MKTDQRREDGFVYVLSREMIVWKQNWRWGRMEQKTRDWYYMSSVSDFLQVLQDRFHNVGGRALASKVRSQDLAFSQNAVNSVVHLESLGGVAEVLQKKTGRADSGNRVGDTLACNVRCRTVDRLADNEVVTYVGRRDDTQWANQGSSTVTFKGILN